MTERLIRWVFKARGLLMLPPMAFLALCTRWEIENEALVFGLGGSVFVLGLALRVWAQMHLHYRLKVRKVLTSTGPYRAVRNPIYIGNGLMLTGSCFLAELFWFAPIMLAYVGVVYHLVVRHEEAHLRGKYGPAYQAYIDEVPRWLPRKMQVAMDAEGSIRSYLWPSVASELHNLLLLAPFLVKEIWLG